MRRRIAIATMLVLVAIPLAAAPAAAKDPNRARHDRVVAYWTAERMASAKPRDFIRVGGTFKPAAKPDKAPGKPGGGGGGGGSTPTVTGASWNGGGAVLRGTGKVFFTMGSSNYVCSGSVVTESRAGYSLVLTAAHCAYDEVAKAFASKWMFIPEYDSTPTSNCPQTKYGCWTASGLAVHNGYATAGGFNTQATEHDYAFAIVPDTGKSKGNQYDATVGSFPITYTASSPDHRYAFGYPAAGKYKGNDLVYCAGTIFSDSNNANKTWGMGCEMTGGSSGGPWFSSFNASTGSGTLSSLNSYGYSGVKNMYGPKFDSRTKAVFDKANSTTSGGVIAP
jgi:V8-like Glu-specific endopeptidase